MSVTRATVLNSSMESDTIYTKPRRRLLTQENKFQFCNDFDFDYIVAYYRSLYVH